MSNVLYFVDERFIMPVIGLQSFLFHNTRNRRYFNHILVGVIFLEDNLLFTSKEINVFKNIMCWFLSFYRNPTADFCFICQWADEVIK